MLAQFSLFTVFVEVTAPPRRSPPIPFIAVCLLFCLKIAGANTGIAARYPGDKNIETDPALIFADYFESYTSTSEIQNKWDQVYQLPNIRIAAEPGNFFAGSKALEFSLPISANEVVNSLGKHLNPTRDTVFLRAYTKFDAGYTVSGPGRNGLRLSANYPGPGIMPPANGTGFFLFLLQNNIEGIRFPAKVSPAIPTFTPIGQAVIGLWRPLVSRRNG